MLNLYCISFLDFQKRTFFFTKVTSFCLLTLLSCLPQQGSWTHHIAPLRGMTRNQFKKKKDEKNPPFVYTVNNRCCSATSHMLFNIIKTIIHLFIFAQCVQAGITDLAGTAFMNA